MWGGNRDAHKGPGSGGERVQGLLTGSGMETHMWEEKDNGGSHRNLVRGTGDGAGGHP